MKKFFYSLMGKLLKQLAVLFGKADSHSRKRRLTRAGAAKRRRRKAAFLRWTTIVGVGICAVMFLIGIGKLIGYGYEYLASAMSSRYLRQAYYETGDAVPALTPPADAPMPQQNPVIVITTIAPDAAEVAVSAPPAQETPASAQGTPEPTLLRSFRYPSNPHRVVSSRFHKIRQQNADVVGWLTIDGLLDEAVVQRDNIFYMTRDYLGRSNVNGAIFLDEIISLDERPYTLILYGHNMRSGAMFGGLRNYEDPVFFRNNPFITFDSIYEDGRYVIFSVAMVSVRNTDSHYLDVGKLISSNVENRDSVLSMLRDASAFDTGISVRADDQVLLLVTCVGDESERRIIAARRLRSDETVEGIAYQVQQSVGE